MGTGRSHGGLYQTCRTASSLKLESTKYGVRSTEYGVRSTKYGVRSSSESSKVMSRRAGGWKVRSTKYGVQSSLRLESTEDEVRSTVELMLENSRA